MRVLVIVHDEDAGPGVFGDVLAAAEAEVDSWLPAEQPDAPASPAGYDAILSFGGAAHPHQEDRHPWLATEKRFLSQTLEQDVPLLGICLGAELIAEAAGAEARHMQSPEIGWYDVQLTADGAADPLLGPVGESFPALEWHSYSVPLPPLATALASSANCLQAYRLGQRGLGAAIPRRGHGRRLPALARQLHLRRGRGRRGHRSDRDRAGDRAAACHWHLLGRGICERFLQVAAQAQAEDGYVRDAL